MSAFTLSMVAPLSLGVPPTDVSTDCALSSSGMTVKSRNDMVQYGAVYWSLVGAALGTSGDGVATRNATKSLKKKKCQENGILSIPDEMIKVPMNVTPKNLKKFTFYDLLGVGGALAGSADENAIKRGYHKCVLIYHPDKKQDKKKDGVTEDNSVWLKIQKAFDTLLDKDKRRAYDSQLPFNEKVPSDIEIEEALAKGNDAFYAMYGEVFNRNARFAEIKPVPDFGDENTPIEEVERFYAYWIKFESWRDFTGVGAEYKPEEASSREEKRFMMKENEKLAMKLKKKEIGRIADMTMKAMKNDPRIIADKAAKSAAKEAAAKAKEEEQANAAAIAAQKEAEAKEVAAFAKQEKEKAKKKASAARNSFRKLLRAIAANRNEDGDYGSIPVEDVEFMLSKLTTDNVDMLNDAMGGVAAVKSADLLCPAGWDVVITNIEDVKGRKTSGETDDGEKRIEIAIEKTTERQTRVWTTEELSALAKAIGKYPGGTGNRWTAVCNHMNDLLKPQQPFTDQECLKAANNAMKSGAAGPIKVDSSGAAWTLEQQKQLEIGLRKYPASMNAADRWDVISTGVVGKSKKDCIERYKMLCGNAKK